MTQSHPSRRFGPVVTGPLLVATALLSACVEPPAAPPPPKDLPARVVEYRCTGGPLSVAYAGSKITLPGNETLLAEDDSNQRYSWPSDGTHHVWEIKGGIGTLLLHDGTTGKDSVQKSACTPK